MKNNIRKWFLSLAASGLLLVGSNVQSAPGDVQGRDLNVSILGSIGHIGLEGNNSVYEMLGPTRSSEFNLRTSSLHKNSVGNFKNSGTYWGSKYSNLLNSSQHRWRITDYIVPNAHVMYRLGAEYSYTAIPRHSKGVIYSNGRKRLTKIGAYRCDSFVKSMYGTGGVSLGYVTLPKYIYNILPNKR
jgi:hypothetical protein